MPMENLNCPKPSVTVIVPMCNEEESMGILREKLGVLHQRLNNRFAVEYCLVDDGSTDRTRRLMASAAPPGAACICRSHRTNRGLGAALRTGLQAASGSIVCTIDADCSYPPEDLCALIDVVRSGQADVAVASPYHPQGGVSGVKPWRILLSRQCSRLYRCCSPLKLHTYTSIFRAYRGTVARELEFSNDGFVSLVEMLLCAHRRGARIAEIPLVLRARQRGYSKIRIARTIRAHLGMMLAQLQWRARNGFRASRGLLATELQSARENARLSAAAKLGKEESSIG